MKDTLFRPLVSILTSCYNGSRFIGQYSECLLSQTYRPLECIIVNDGSEDNSRQLLDNLAKEANKRSIRVRIIHQENTGNAQAISNAYSISTGDLITCWDIDDIFFPENISTLVETLKSSPTYSSAIANGYYVNALDTDRIISTFSEQHPKYKGSDLFEHLLVGTAWNWPGSYIVKSSVLEETYGTRTIPVSRLWKNSQNLQLLLPACFIGAAYNDNTIMKYVVRNDSISHKCPTYANDLHRINTFEDIRYQILEIMDLATPENKKNIRIAFDRIKMHTAYRYSEKNDFLVYYNHLSAEKSLTIEDNLLKIDICRENNLKKIIYKIIHKIYTLFNS